MKIIINTILFFTMSTVSTWSMSESEALNKLTKIYKDCLRRGLDPSGKSTFLPQVKAGKEAAVKSAVCNSPEAKRLASNGKTPSPQPTVVGRVVQSNASGKSSACLRKFGTSGSRRFHSKGVYGGNAPGILDALKAPVIAELKACGYKVKNDGVHGVGNEMKGTYRTYYHGGWESTISWY